MGLQLPLPVDEAVTSEKSESRGTSFPDSVLGGGSASSTSFKSAAESNTTNLSVARSDDKLELQFDSVTLASVNTTDTQEQVGPSAENISDVAPSGVINNELTEHEAHPESKTYTNSLQAQLLTEIVSTDIRLSEDEANDLFPFRILVTVLHAESLIAPDSLGLNTTDPYVKVVCNDRVIGTTAIVKKNFIKPVWNETFKISLVSLRQSLVFRVYDKNSLTDDVIIGVVELNLQTAYEDGASSFSGMSYCKPLLQPQRIDLEGQGSLYFSVKIEVSHSEKCRSLNYYFLIFTLYHL